MRSPYQRVLLLGLFFFGILAGCGDRRIVFCNAASADIDNGGCGATGGTAGAAAGGTGGAAGTSGGGGLGGSVSEAGSGGSGGNPILVGGGGGSAPLDASVFSEDAGLDAGDAASP